MGKHVFLDHMPFKITCVMIAYVLKEVYIYIYINLFVTVRFLVAVRVARFLCAI